MTVISQPVQPTEAVVERPLLSAAEVEASCRGPVLLLLFSSGIWLVFGGIFGFIASMKFHAPYFLDGTPAFTYGRMAAARTNVLLYGFAIQSGLAVALWLFCRLGRARMAIPGIASVAAAIWNLGVLIGLAGILIGDNTGFEFLEFPRYSAPILFTGFVGLGLSALLTFHGRATAALYPSQWFILAAIFWFAWIFISANTFLICAPLRGMAQAAVHWWYMNNLTTIVIGFLGLAPLLYFIPKLTQRPLYSRHLATLAFWVFLLFGSWGGIHTGAPLPAWLPSMSAVGMILSSLAVLALATNFLFTLRGDQTSKQRKIKDPLLGFFTWGAISFVVAAALAIIGSLRNVNEVVYFTWFLPAQFNLGMFGFFALTIFGAAAYIVPRLTGITELPFARGLFLTTLAAAAIMFLSLAGAGVMLGLGMNNPDRLYLDVLRSSLGPFRISTMGEILVIVAGVIFSWSICDAVRSCIICQIGGVPVKAGTKGKGRK